MGFNIFHYLKLTSVSFSLTYSTLFILAVKTLKRANLKIAQKKESDYIFISQLETNLVILSLSHTHTLYSSPHTHTHSNSLSFSFYLSLCLTHTPSLNPSLSPSIPHSLCLSLTPSLSITHTLKHTMHCLSLFLFLISFSHFSFHTQSLSPFFLSLTFSSVLERMVTITFCQCHLFIRLLNLKASNDPTFTFQTLFNKFRPKREIKLFFVI